PLRFVYCFLLFRPAPESPLFPYTTLFRSQTIVYIHVLSAFGMFSLWVSELIVFLANRVGDDSIKRVKRYLGFSQVTSMIIVLATGFYLMHYRGGPQAWLVVSVVLLLSTIPASIAFLRSPNSSKSMHNRLRFLFV